MNLILNVCMLHSITCQQSTSMSILMQTERYNKPKQKVAISSVTLNERQDLHNIRVPLPTPTPASREASSSVSGYFLAGRRRTELTVVHLAGRLAADAGASIWPGGAGWDLVVDANVAASSHRMLASGSTLQHRKVLISSTAAEMAEVEFGLLMML